MIPMTSFSVCDSSFVILVLLLMFLHQNLNFALVQSNGQNFASDIGTVNYAIQTVIWKKVGEGQTGQMCQVCQVQMYNLGLV